MSSDMSRLPRFLRKASDSSMNRIMPLGWFSAQSNSLFSSVTASLPRGAISEPTMTANSRPLYMASFFAKRVLPVPGGPQNIIFLHGAQCCLRLSTAYEISRIYSCSRFSRMTPLSRSCSLRFILIKILFYIQRNGSVRQFAECNFEVSLTSFGFPNLAIMRIPSIWKANLMPKKAPKIAKLEYATFPTSLGFWKKLDICQPIMPIPVTSAYLYVSRLSEAFQCIMSVSNDCFCAASCSACAFCWSSCCCLTEALSWYSYSSVYRFIDSCLCKLSSSCQRRCQRISSFCCSFYLSR